MRKCYNRYSRESQIESLKEQIDYLQSIECHRLADLLVEDLEKVKASVSA